MEQTAMHPFEFSTAQQILFGQGKTQQLPEIVRHHHLRRCLVVTTKSGARFQSVIDRLTQADVEVIQFSVPTEPSIQLVREGTLKAISGECDGVIAIGGGSVIDTGKAIAALMRNTEDLMEYLEVIGKGKPMQNPSAPWIAVPTTSGTGSEVTRNAVLSSPEHKVKVSLRSTAMLPVAAIVDPNLTRELPPQQTAWSGLDALTQLIEPYVSRRANSITDALCLEALPLAALALPVVFQDGEDIDARTDMSLASLFGGLALANAGLGVIHGFAGPLGGMFDAPHGAICAALLPYGMAANIARLELTRNSDPSATKILDRYRVIARHLTGKETAEPKDGVIFVEKLIRELEIQPLRNFGMKESDAQEVVEKAMRANSMKANPVTLASEELTEVYLRAL
jgi:alcohol dehydrogenase class IV